MKIIINLILLIGLILITISLTKKYTINNYCYNSNIKNLNKINREIENQYKTKNNISELINTLFNEKSIWLNSIGSNSEKNIK